MIKNKLTKLIVLLLCITLLTGNAAFVALGEEEFFEGDLVEEPKTEETVPETPQVEEQLPVEDEQAPAPAEEPEPVEELSPEEYTLSENEKIDLLGALGIIKPLPDADETISRGRFASYMANLCGKTLIGADKNSNYFKDIKGTNPNLASINAMYTMGIMNGVGSGKFDPEAPVSFNSAITVMVRILGYDVVSQENGGYFDGYSRIATKLRLGGAGITEDGLITGRTLVNLIYEALFTDILEEISYSAEGVEYAISDTTLLESNFEYREYEGLVVADYYSSIGGRKRASERQLVINMSGVDYSYKIKYTSTKDLLSRNVIYYANPEGEIIHIMLSEGAREEIVIDALDFCEVDEYIRQITYYEKGGKSKKTADISRSADIIYNGVNEDINADDIRTANGEIRLVDYTGDRVYDCVFVTNYVHYMSNGITADGILKDMRSGMYFDFRTEDSNYSTNVIKYGISTTMSLINASEIVSVAVSRNTVGVRKITAVVTGYLSDGIIEEIGDTYIIINGKEYETTKGFQNGGIYLGDNVIFGLDSNGRLCAVKRVYNNTRFYVYLTGYHRTSDLHTICKVRGMNESGEFVEYSFADKFRVNGERGTADKVQQKAYAGGTEVKRQLVAVFLDDDGNIKEIQFDNTIDGPRQETDKDVFSHNAHFADGRFDYPRKTIAAQYWLNNNTRIFIVFTDGDGDVLEELSSEYTRVWRGMMYRRKMVIDVYDALETNREAGAIMFTVPIGLMSEYFSGGGLFIVDKTVNMINSEGDVVPAAKGMMAGGKKTLFELDECYSGISSWKSGDIYSVALVDDKVVRASKVFALKTESPATSGCYYFDKVYQSNEQSADSEQIQSEFIRVMGRLRNIEKGYLTRAYIEVKGSGRIYTHSFTSTTKLYEYDTSSKKIRVISIDDLVGGAEEVFVTSAYGQLTNLIVIK